MTRRGVIKRLAGWPGVCVSSGSGGIGGTGGSNGTDSCIEAGNECTGDPGACCRDTTCIYDPYNPDAALCAANCLEDEECMSLCCVPLESSSDAVCGPSVLCASGSGGTGGTGGTGGVGPSDPCSDFVSCLDNYPKPYPPADSICFQADNLAAAMEICANSPGCPSGGCTQCVAGTFWCTYWVSRAIDSCEAEMAARGAYGSSTMQYFIDRVSIYCP
jgi:hypothetical protein